MVTVPSGLPPSCAADRRRRVGDQFVALGGQGCPVPRLVGQPPAVLEDARRLHHDLGVSQDVVAGDLLDAPRLLGIEPGVQPRPGGHEPRRRGDQHTQQKP